MKTAFILPALLSIDGLDSVIAVLEQENGETRRMQLALAYMENNNFTEARQILDSMALVAGFENFAAINNIIIDILEDSATFDTLLTDTLLRATVESIADDSLHHGYLQARAILTAVFDTIFPEYIEELPPPPQLKTGNPSDTTDSIITEKTVTQMQEEIPPIQEDKQYFRIYPNPANSKFYVEYRFMPGNDQGSITISEITGKQLREYALSGNIGKIEIEVDSWDGGLYFYMVRNRTAVLRRGKLIVAR